MTSRIVSKLCLAAVLAGAVPAVAAAADRDHDRAASPAVTLPAPRFPAPVLVRGGPRGEEWREHRREATWRERELASISAQLATLDAERSQFHARFARSPGKLRKYDRGYFERRAELERRWSELQRVAWR